MRGLNITFSVKCDTKEVLEKLRTNLASHRQIVEEARTGYILKAQVELTKRIKQLAEGQIVNLQFSMSPPQDMSSAYETAIQMLELHQEPTLMLSASEVRMLVQDEWDWADSFLLANAGYSGTASASARTKGLM